VTRVTATWTDNELLQYSKDHLVYEIQMFFHCAVLLKDSCSQLVISPFVRNLLLEGFAIHLRGLMDFLSANPKDKDDVLADDYIGTVGWKKPTWSPAANKARTRVNKEVGHLTASRKHKGDPAKGWDSEISLLIPEVLARLEQFLNAADPKKLASEVRDVVPVRRTSAAQ
jgi:hypothetical protein